jgi:hypothetical protein
LRTGAGASFVGAGVALSLAILVSGKASSEVVAVGGCGSADGAGGVDFGCHFLRSGGGAIDSLGDAGVSMGVDGVLGAVSAIEGVVGL